MSYANPFLVCETCARQTTHYDPELNENLPCGHVAGIRSLCQTWSPVDGCTCRTPCRRPTRRSYSRFR